MTLTAACTVILLDRPWTPGDARQAEDRVRRIGQTKAVKSVWMSAFEMDTQIDQMLESKNKVTSAVLDEGHTSSGGSSAKIDIQQLLNALLPKINAM